jgi:hypothetical protein
MLPDQGSAEIEQCMEMAVWKSGRCPSVAVPMLVTVAAVKRVTPSQQILLGRGVGKDACGDRGGQKG